jgi:cell division protease FtsH
MVQLAAAQNSYLGMGAASKPYSEETARRIDKEVQRIIHESHEQAKELLIKHRAQLDALVEALLAGETLDEQQILSVTGLPAAPRLESGRISAVAGAAAMPALPSST